MEPDDRIALAIVAARMAEKVLLVGTTVMNTWRKAALARHQFSLYESMKNVPVFAGTGEFKKLGLNSTKADNYKATPGQNQQKKHSSKLSKQLQRKVRASINVKNCLECIKLIFDPKIPSLQLIKQATLSWDTHLIERMLLC
uniref:Uncharacterized protein n=1 Tax=Ditylenchus dipsaci TaxID=166011 RepID=A0A915DBM4_9BILA